MFCPQCRCEYRAGFTRCGECEVDLVAELTAVADAPAASEPSGAWVECCGYVELGDARSARDTLHRAGLHAEIVIRDLSAGRPEVPAEEEYWIRVPANDVRRVAAMLDDGSPRHSEVKCSECGTAVSPDEAFCGRCGARFE
jgi:hypothetical protein